MREQDRVETALVELDLNVKHASYCSKSFAELRPRYHNELHCFSTALTFRELAEVAQLPLDEMRHGFLAALYHDAAHLMKTKDALNVKSAIKWVRGADFLEDSLDLSEIERLIRATQNDRKRFTTKAELLIHDADVLQTVKGSVMDNLLWQKRLAEELALSVTWESSLHFVLDNVHCPETMELIKRTLGHKKHKPNH